METVNLSRVEERACVKQIKPRIQVEVRVDLQFCDIRLEGPMSCMDLFTHTSMNP